MSSEMISTPVIFPDVIDISYIPVYIFDAHVVRCFICLSVCLLDKLYIIKGVFHRKWKNIKSFCSVHLTLDYTWSLILDNGYNCKFLPVK